MKKTIVIIGGGIAGLSAGCYAQMNGYDSCIYELHNLPGGLCTSWKRGEYTFDGCIDWLTGSGPDGMFYPVWEELGVIQNNEFHYEEEYCRFINQNCQELTLFLDPDKLEQELNRFSPEDGKVSADLCSAIRRLKGFRPNVAKAVEVMGLADYIEMMADLLVHIKQYQNFFKNGRISMENFAAQFKNNELKEMFSNIWNRMMPVSLFAATMAWCAGHTAGYPLGGSLKMAIDIEKRYLKLGGKVFYKKRVAKITVKDGTATGITLEDGTNIPADIVISAADGHSTLFGMLGGNYLSNQLKDWYDHSPTFPSYIQISLGVNRDMRGQPRLYYWKLAEPLTIAGRETYYMILHNYSFDPALSPAGKSPLVVRFFTEYDYWIKLKMDNVKYNEEKERLAEAVIDRLCILYPGIREQIEIVDVATPATYVRYTDTWRGATMSWLPTTDNFAKSLKKTLPGLKSFYMAGQWLVPGGGIPNAVKTGRDVIQMICKADRKSFQTSTPT